MKRLLLSMTCFGFSALSLPAFAATTTGNMDVSAEVIAVCTITATSLTFSGYSQTVATDATADATAQCTGTSGTLTFTVGDGANFTGGSRRITDSTNFINYAVAQTVGGTDLINTDAVPIAVSAATGAGTTTLYGRIPPGQGNKPAGIYNDTVVLTLTY